MQRFRALFLIAVAFGVLGAWLAFGGTIGLAQEEGQGGTAPPTEFRSINVADGFTIASVGDLIIEHPATQNPEKQARFVNPTARRRSNG